MKHYNQLQGVVIIVGLDGAELQCTAPDGEIQWIMGLESGEHRAEKYLRLMQPTDALEVVGGVFVKENAGRMVALKHPNNADTGANPDWTPTQASALEMKMRETLRRVDKQTKTLDRRIAALTKLEAARPAPEPDPEPVEEPEPELTPEPDPAPDAPAKS